MKTYKAHRQKVAVLLLVVLMSMSAGCPTIRQQFTEATNTPRKRWLLASDLLTATRKSLEAMIRNDELEQKHVNMVKKWEPVATDALEDWDEALSKGEPAAVEEAEFKDALRRLEEIERSNE